MDGSAAGPDEVNVDTCGEANDSLAKCDVGDGDAVTNALLISNPERGVVGRGKIEEPVK